MASVAVKLRAPETWYPDISTQSADNLRWSVTDVSNTYLGVQSSESSVECIVGKFGSDSAANTATTGDVSVGANFIGSPGVVDSRVLDQNLDIDLVQVFRHAEETSCEVLGCLDHTILRFGTEDWKSVLSGEVVGITQLGEQVSVNAHLE